MNPKKISSLQYLIILSVLWFASANAEVDNEPNYLEIEWVELIPKDDLDALLTPPEYLSNIQDGSEQDSVEALSNAAVQDLTTQRFQQALTSVRVIDKFNNQAVKIPGFVVPLRTDEQQRVTEFFIVPYFGACLHMPPPPPNQMIHSKAETGIELAQLTEPFWFEGVIHIETISNITGTSAYGMTLDNIQAYE